MKEPVLILLVIMLILTTFVFVSAQTETKELEEKAGITPDNPILWSLERFAEQARLFFTFDDVKKAELRLQFAEERIAEIEVMIQKGTLGAERLAEMIKIHGVQKVVNLSQEFQDNETKIKFREMVQKHVALLQDVIKLLPEEKSIELQDFINNSFNFTIPVEPKEEKKTNWKYCENDSDCILRLNDSDCGVCSRCGIYRADNPEVIAINKSWNQTCSLAPEHQTCVACAVAILFNISDIRCVNNTCIKIIASEQLKEEPTIKYECISDSDCAGDKICDNYICRALNCTEGNYASNHKCNAYGCKKDEDCGITEYCSEYQCKTLKCADCRYITNHTCHVYECCKNEDCRVKYKCEEHKCVVDECFINETKPSNESVNISFETVQIEANQYIEYNGSNFRFSENCGFNLIKSKGELEDIRNGIGGVTKPYFSNFDNYFLIMVYMKNGCTGEYIEIENITQQGWSIYVTFKRGGQYRCTGEQEGWHIIKVNRSDLVQREYLHFFFIGNTGEGYHKIQDSNLPLSIELSLAPPKNKYLPSCTYYKICREYPCCNYYYCRDVSIEGGYHCNRIFSCMGISEQLL